MTEHTKSVVGAAHPTVNEFVVGEAHPTFERSKNMKATKCFTLMLAAVLLVQQGASAQCPQKVPVGTAFTYQGLLTHTNPGTVITSPVRGPCDFKFSLWDDPITSQGCQIGTTLSVSDVAVTDGHFTVQLDFDNVYTGNKRFLEVVIVACPPPLGSGTLEPRIELTPVPYALFAGKGPALTDADWDIDNAPNMFAIPTGNVGIGTDTPTEKLHVAINELIPQGRVAARFENLANPAHFSNSVGVKLVSGGTVGTVGVFGAGYSAVPGYAGYTMVGSGNTGIQLVSNALTGVVRFITGSSTGERMRITADGNVGIGTAEPITKLEVADGMIRVSGTSAAQRGVQVNLHAGSGATGIWIGSYGDSTISSGANLSDFYEFRASTSIASGATSTNVYGFFANPLIGGSATNVYAIYGSANGGTNNWAGYFPAGDVYMGGNVGIGTTNPAPFKLAVQGDVCIRGNLCVDGKITTTLGVESGVCSSDCPNCPCPPPSDRRLKDHIKPIAGGLDKVTRLRGVSFQWRRDEFPKMKFRDGKQIGLIAQEVAEVLPEVVVTNPDGYKGIQYGKVVAVLVEAIKEQQQIINSTRSELGDLKQRLAALEAAVGGWHAQAEGAGMNASQPVEHGRASLCHGTPRANSAGLGGALAATALVLAALVGFMMRAHSRKGGAR